MASKTTLEKYKIYQYFCNRSKNIMITTHEGYYKDDWYSLGALGKWQTPVCSSFRNRC